MRAGEMHLRRRGSCSAIFHPDGGGGSGGGKGSYMLWGCRVMIPPREMTPPPADWENKGSGGVGDLFMQVFFYFSLIRFDATWTSISFTNFLFSFYFYSEKEKKAREQL